MWHDDAMSETWNPIQLQDVEPGDFVRFRGHEFEVARVDPRFLGRDAMICLIEDGPARVHAYPGPLDAEVERRESAS